MAYVSVGVPAKQGRGPWGRQAGRKNHGQAENHRQELKLLVRGLSPCKENLRHLFTSSQLIESGPPSVIFIPSSHLLGNLNHVCKIPFTTASRLAFDWVMGKWGGECMLQNGYCLPSQEKVSLAAPPLTPHAPSSVPSPFLFPVEKSGSMFHRISPRPTTF